MAGMHFVYGAAHENASGAQRLYKDWFPMRHTPDWKTFEYLHRHLCETGSFAMTKQGVERVSGRHNLKKTFCVGWKIN